MSNVSIPTGDGTMGAYLAIPQTAGPWPGVLVVHDALGMTKPTAADARLRIEPFFNKHLASR